MKKYLLTISCLLSLLKGSSQDIQVLDSVTMEPIAGVALYAADHQRVVFTNSFGIVSLKDFSGVDTLLITHIAYSPIATTKSAILRSNNLVLLNMRSDQLAEVVYAFNGYGKDNHAEFKQLVSLSAADVLFKNSQTSADILASSGKIFVQKSQLGGGSPMIRGFATNRLLITVDGVRMNNAIFRGGNIQNLISLDPFVVERVDVSLGPGSVIYGSDAIGGVMNFITLKPTFATGVAPEISGGGTIRYASANHEKTTHTDVNVGWKKWATLTSVTFSDFGDLRMGKHGPDAYLRREKVITRQGLDLQVLQKNPLIQDPTGYSQISLAQKAIFQQDDGWKLALHLLYSETSAIDRYDRLTIQEDGQFRSAAWYYGPQIWLSGNIQVEKMGQGRYYDMAKWVIAYQQFKESRNNRAFGSDLFFSGEENVQAYSSSIDFRKNIGSNSLFYGVDYVYNQVNSAAVKTNLQSISVENEPSRYPDNSSWQSLAAYGSFSWKWQPALSMQAGLRYNQFFINAALDPRFYSLDVPVVSIQKGNLTGSVALKWQATPSLAVKSSLSTAFRAPNIDDIGKIFDSEPGSVVVPNPKLKAEYAYNGEIGLQYSFTPQIKIELASFFTRLDNALVRRDFMLNGSSQIEYQGALSNVQAIQNAAHMQVYGLEAGMEATIFKDLTLKIHHTITRGFEEEDTGTTVPIRHAPPPFGSTHITWHKYKFKLAGYAMYNGRLSHRKLAPIEVAKHGFYPLDAQGNPYAPAWYTLNVTAQYHFFQNWQTTMSLENLTDQRYRTYSSGIAAPGRNLIVALKVAF